ncbi:hypothetical protein [Roseibium album]|uniref:hypothetical protein n=1 Tax=Roseibium album TaxID=311410 RepID=UPI002493843C|nr:hypothetical protein [Roseibium album]
MWIDSDLAEFKLVIPLNQIDAPALPPTGTSSRETADKTYILDIKRNRLRMYQPVGGFNDPHRCIE